MVITIVRRIWLLIHVLGRCRRIQGLGLGVQRSLKSIELLEHVTNIVVSLHVGEHAIGVSSGLVVHNWIRVVILALVDG